MEKLMVNLAIFLIVLATILVIWAFYFEIRKTLSLASEQTTTFFFRNHLPDAIGVEYFKRTIKEDEVVTCYWITGSKDEVLFHTCKQRSLYD